MAPTSTKTTYQHVSFGYRFPKSGLLLLAFIVGLFFGSPLQAQVHVTQAPQVSRSADVVADPAANTWISLGAIRLEETEKGESGFGSGSGRSTLSCKLYLQAPLGWVFRESPLVVESNFGAPNTDFVSKPTATLVEGQVVVSYSVDNSAGANGKRDWLSLSGLYAKPTDGSDAPNQRQIRATLAQIGKGNDKPVFLTTIGSFAIEPGAFAAFLVEKRDNRETAHNPIDLKVSATDQFGNVTPGFTGSVNLTASNGALVSGGSTANFEAGILESHGVVLNDGGEDIRITATGKSPYTDKAGTSDPFTVYNPIPKLNDIRFGGVSTQCIPQGTATRILSVHGSGFVGSSEVKLSNALGMQFSTTFISQEELRVQVPSQFFESPGSYPVFVVNPAPAKNRHTSNARTIAVTTDAAPEILTQPVDVEVAPGGTAIFAVEAASADSQMKYQWYKDGLSLTGGANRSRISGINTPELRISQAIASDAGQYMVVVSSKNGNCTLHTISQEATLSIQVPPFATVWEGDTDSNWFLSDNWSNGVPNASATVEIPAVGGSVRYSPTITDAGDEQRRAQVKDMRLQGVLAVTETGFLEIFGAFTKQGAAIFEAGSGSTVAFVGEGRQVIPSATFDQLNLKGTVAKVLGGQVLVTGVLDLGQGMLELGSHNLVIGQDGFIDKADKNHFVVTNGLGLLQINGLGLGEPRLFPVGSRADSYSPATILNEGVLDDFTVKVLDGVRTEGFAGAFLTQQVVQKTWDIAELLPGGSQVTLALEWEKKEETENFDRFLAFVSHYKDNSWNRQPSVPGYENHPLNTALSIVQPGITSFSPFGVGSGDNAPLPVTLKSFTATQQGDDALLSWATATEIDNQGFGVEVSADGRQFRSLQFIRSKGDTRSEARRYTFLDQEPGKAGTRFYRLRQTDMDGTTVYSAVRAVSFRVSGNRVSAYPNPFVRNLTLVVHAEREERLSLTITDALGRTIFHREQDLQKGANDIFLDLDPGLSPGLYVVSTRYSGAVQQIKLVKRK